MYPQGSKSAGNCKIKHGLIKLCVVMSVANIFDIDVFLCLVSGLVSRSSFRQIFSYSYRVTTELSELPSVLRNIWKLRRVNNFCRYVSKRNSNKAWNFHEALMSCSSITLEILAAWECNEYHSHSSPMLDGTKLQCWSRLHLSNHNKDT